MSPDFKDLNSDAEFSLFLGRLVALPKYGYGPVAMLRGVSGGSQFVKLDPANDSFQSPSKGLAQFPVTDE